MGLETEYAIRYSGVEASPGNGQIYDALVRAISRQVAARPGDAPVGKNQIFLENGGAFYYEHLPHCPEGGLVEGATPECRSPSQVLLYQKAQEALLLEALPWAQEEMQNRGFGGELGLVKNCLDGEGHVYGAQENYQVSIASGLALGLYRLGLVLLLPVILVQAVMSFLVQVAIAIVLVLMTILAVGTLFLPFRVKVLEPLIELAEADERSLGRFFGRFQLWLAYFLSWPITAPLSLLFWATAFRDIRHQATAFFVSRPVLSGAGTVTPEGRFGLSEKGPAIRRILRTSIRPDNRPLFDTGNLMKQAALPLSFRVAPLFRLFDRHQRLQLGLSDSNAAQVAEYLKVASTQLVLDMVESGYLTEAPRMRRPISALLAIVADPALTETVVVRRGAGLLGTGLFGTEETKSALEIQRYYLNRARAFVNASPTVSLESRQTVELWDEMLSALEEGRQEDLIGKLDWVTKRFFLESCQQEASADLETGPEADLAVDLASDSEPEEQGSRASRPQRGQFLKTLDLRYHELGSGYFARLEAEGLAPRLVEPEEVHRAMTTPPTDSPAWWRGRFIRSRGQSAIPVRVSWASAWIGGRFQGRVVEFRPRGRGPSPKR
ncbi:MAG: proteasome accessory factor PafA2 family protein [Deltaproteobacteria bacterium]|nr:proteasome accessory factor PafA2 family protein [Deltaproteobacteria bacterium]